MNSPYIYLLLCYTLISACTIRQQNNSFTASHALPLIPGTDNNILYIATYGDDKYIGLRDQPLATLSGARDRIRQIRKEKEITDTFKIIILDGQYQLDHPLLLSAEDGGNPKAPIIYQAEKGSSPVFYGGISIKGFEKVSENLWRAPVYETALYKWHFEQLYVNGKRAIRARHPNDGFFNVRGEVREIPVSTNGGKKADLAAQQIGIYSPQIDFLKNLSENDRKNTIWTFYHNWDVTRKKIIGFSIKDTAIFTIGEGMSPWNKINSSTLYTIENTKAALDSPGEWYLDPEGFLYYIPRPGEKIDNITCYAPSHDLFIKIEGSAFQPVKHIHFEGLSFKVAGYSMPESGNEAIQAAALVDATVLIDHAHHIEFRNCEIAHTGSYGIWFRKACSNSRVEHCYLHDLGAGGVKIGETTTPTDSSSPSITNNITIHNSIIRSGGHVFPCAVGIIIFHAKDNDITHNEIADFRYTGISVGWIWGYEESFAKRNRIAYNHIHHLGWGILSDMGGIYTLGKSEGTRINNNVIHHIYSYSYGGWGLYTDEGSSGIIMENNLVYNCKSSGFHQHYGKDNIIRNNIFASQWRAQLEATRKEDHSSFTFTQNIIYFNRGILTNDQWGQINFSSDHNLYWDTRGKITKIGNKTLTEWRAEGKDRNSIFADPKFVDPLRGNFQIQNKHLLKQIGFKSFDYSKAGVYGDPYWLKLARFDPELAKKFDQMVIKQETNR